MPGDMLVIMTFACIGAWVAGMATGWLLVQVWRKWYG